MKDFFATLFVLIFALAFSWIITVLVLKLIAFMFEIAFSWKIATGIWLCLLLIRNTVVPCGKDK